MRRAGDSRIVKAMKNSRTCDHSAQCQRHLLDAGAIDAAREELVGLARVAREQPLQVAGLQILRVDVEEIAGPRGRSARRPLAMRPLDGANGIAS